MGDTGLEPTHISPKVNNNLQNPAKTGGAESGAVSADLPQIAPDLAEVVAAWPKLPDPVKAGGETVAGDIFRTLLPNPHYP